VLRVASLLAGDTSGGGALYGGSWIFGLGVATLAFAAAGLLAAQDLRRQAAYAIMVSSGTLLAAIGYAQADVLGPALYYLPVSTLTAAAFFLLIEIIEQDRPA